MDELFDTLFQFHQRSKKINPKKSQHLKAGILAFLKDRQKVLNLRKQRLFTLDKLPQKPGIWDQDIIEALFQNTLVSPVDKVRPWYLDWQYFKHDAEFSTMIVNRYAKSMEQKRDYKLALQMYKEYEQLRYQKSIATKFLDPEGPWEVHFWSKRTKPRTNVLPRTEISGRVNKINQYLNSKEYPATKVVIHSTREKNATFRKKALMALQFAINGSLISKFPKPCPYTNGIMAGRHKKTIAIALNNGIVVGGFSWEFRGQSLHIKYLCSSKLVPNVGTVCLYAAEEFARHHDKKRVYLLAAANAKPFYFKVGYNYLTEASRGSSVRSTEASSRRNKKKNSNTSNTATSKRKLVLPTRSNRKMRRYI
jgi:hypothetical protein